VIPKGPWTARRAARQMSSSFSWGALASPGVLDYAIMELGDQAAGVAARTADTEGALAMFARPAARQTHQRWSAARLMTHDR
jgi:hypothetical protein